MDKPQLGLIPPEFDEEEARAWESGIKNGREAFDWRRTATVDQYTHKLLRHLNAWRKGIKYDQDSGAHHLAHVICNAKILMWCEARDKLKQERATCAIPKNN